MRREDGSWLIDGMAPWTKSKAFIDLKDMRGDGDFHTLGGFMVDSLGRLPDAGDHFTLGRNPFRSRRHGRPPRGQSVGDPACG